MPDRTISQKNAASKAIKVITADISAPIGLPNKKGISKKNQSKTMTKGIERIPFTYTVAGQ
jgi:hypothetical protein